MQIWFYDVSPTQELAHLNGQLLTSKELLEQYSMMCRNRPGLVLSPEKFLELEFHPYGAGTLGWKRWSSYFVTAVQLISGQLPTKEEIQLAKGLVMDLKRRDKERMVDPSFVLCFLPYVFAALKIHRGFRFSENSNPVGYVRDFILNLWGQPSVLVSTFLCSHREPKVGSGFNLLQTDIPEYKIQRSLGVILGLLNNCQTLDSGRLMILQQGPTAQATMTIFPEVTIVYLQEGRAIELLHTVNLQYQIMQRAISSIIGGKVSIRLQSVDVLSSRVERLMISRYGKSWYSRNFFPWQEQRDPLVSIGIQQVLPAIRQLMPFFTEDFQSNFLSKGEFLVELNRQNAGPLADKAEDVVRTFLHSHRMNVGAKAVYEAAFYFSWGKYCGKSKRVFALGLDRDHDRYQSLAWNLGLSSMQPYFPSGQQQLLSLRRNPSGRSFGSLADLSYRQFWRHGK